MKEAISSRSLQGHTRPEQQETGKGATPRTPNERDTSSDSQSARQSGGQAANKAAHKDAASGRPDTDKGPEMDRVYDKVKGSPN
ncbi:hypothetical protein GT347_11940 [Xylophilus rhododendri]|uniref:Uncharacterized protein n=1 Tax=Xylophilus rhododendri TaxID=2697032 RepID=A0A857J6K0_9BURK|nr:hypothetical protein [Xylophilus rhododendri]QHI98642.1 hypothetical protein GT347_11940 [Xylophilus rhododendri]